MTDFASSCIGTLPSKSKPSKENETLVVSTSRNYYENKNRINRFQNLHPTALKRSVDEVKNFNYTQAIYKLINQPTFLEQVQRVQGIVNNKNKPNICKYISRENCKRRSFSHHYHDYSNHRRYATNNDGSISDMTTKTKNLSNILSKSSSTCNDIHFKKILNFNTQISLGQCSFLNLCHRKHQCKYIHYEMDEKLSDPKVLQFLSRNSDLRFELDKIRNGIGPFCGYGFEGSHMNQHFDMIDEKLIGLVESKNDPKLVNSLVRDFKKTNKDWALFRNNEKSRNTNSTPSINNTLSKSNKGFTRLHYPSASLPPQWIKADIRTLDFSCLGQYNVILMDPPWDIHMELPYGTMKDCEMSTMPIPKLIHNLEPTLLFLWVTGRTKELASTLMRNWGFYQSDVIIWVKTNQLGKIVRTGRTGHWLNHGKEHCLLGIRGQPPPGNLFFNPSHQDHAEHVIRQATESGFLNINSSSGVDDIIVSNVRETSRKPDELYEIIESMCPFGRKIELFGRMHNCRDGWVTVGNQVDGTELHDLGLIESFVKRYPDLEV